ncbi:MAG: hypothetical protein ACI8QD_000405 [Cyclobacteriaceae bacterium]
MLVSYLAESISVELGIKHIVQSSIKSDRLSKSLFKLR